MTETYKQAIAALNAFAMQISRENWRRFEEGR